MPRLMWAICCEKSITNRDSGNISLVEVLEEIHVSSMPVNIETPINLVTLWQKEDDLEDQDESFEFRVPILGPDGESRQEAPNEIEAAILGTSRLARVATDLIGVPVREEGIHRFLIELKVGDQWQEKGYVPLAIKATGELSSA